VPTAVVPRHAYLPLPGGSAGATVTVEPLLCGEVQAPPAFFDRPHGRLWLLRALAVPLSRWSWVPIPAFLVRHPQAGPILIDTGFHPSVAADPKRNLGQLAGRFQRTRMDHDQAVTVQLGRRGLGPADIRMVVMTHLHFDHASAVSEFPDATFVVDRAEWDAASDGGVRQGYNTRHFDHAFDWRVIDFASREVDSFASFGRAVDLLGDGSVRLLSTPGHTHGHMSVLLQLRERELLLCGDAIYSLDSLGADLEPLFCEDRHLYVRSRGEIRRYAEQTPEAVIVPGHDPQTWPRLEPSYA
jgi:glyoxylase-like metal-dependent hydrolase (beta-lactamase superfamily II)